MLFKSDCILIEKLLTGMTGYNIYNRVGLKKIFGLAFHQRCQLVPQSQCKLQIQSTCSVKSPSSGQRSANLAWFKPAAPY